MKNLDSFLQSDSEVKRQYNLLTSIPGIGKITAFSLIATLPDLSLFKSAKQLAAFAGLNPAVRESGSSVKGRGSISKMGSKTHRTALYVPALVAKKNSKNLRAFDEKLKAKGKKPKVAVIAIMHRMLRLVYGCLTKGVPFTEEMA